MKVATPMEYHLAEKPTLDCLQAMGYAFIPPEEHAALRDGENQALFRPHLVAALQRINGIGEADAQAAYGELAAIAGNEAWLGLLRGDYSRIVQGATRRQTLRVLDFTDPANNRFTVTRQLRMRAEVTRVPDLVVHVNGIPLVVIECKSPVQAKDKSGEAFEQIKQYERDIPRLFLSNCFNILTDGTNCLYGSTGSASKFYAGWRDPWPRAPADFPDALSQGLWCLLEPSRLLDLIAHFIVFEKSETGTIKKICRYQQFRAVNRMVERVVAARHRRGLIWHTQGSGKSLTMAFAALKLKTHLTVRSPELANPNILVLTDRIDLHDQISGTFAACGLPNPVAVDSIGELQAHIHAGGDGMTILSTIFKFQGSRDPVPDSGKWIVMVDECHRTQEKDLGAYLRATLPDARFFGFTGTPIRKDDKDTYANFGVAGEGYLDKYGIDDAVADGATVPIYYTGRKTDWHIDEARIDILFDQWFADLPEEKLAEIKQRGVTVADLVKHPDRIDLIAYDIWTHFQEYARPDGLKAQVVAIDREAVILYKRALDRVIAADLVARGTDPTEAAIMAATLSACVYSQSQEDGKPSEDERIQALRHDLKRHYLDDAAEKEVKQAFGQKGRMPEILIVCDKLLTGFDAPIEGVMYLDKPLRDHGLLQAIARTNRVHTAQKRNGLIVDYIGVSANLDEALASYRADDVKNAMRNLEDLRNQLHAAHAAVAAMMRGVKRQQGRAGLDTLKQEFDQLVGLLKTEDRWLEFRFKAREFITLYEEVSPDPAILEFTADLKWVATFLRYGALVFEKREALDQVHYSRKIREMLELHLAATGLSTIIKLRHITDPEFWQDFETDGKTEEELRTAAIRKTAELRKVVYERLSRNYHQYAKFSERLKELLAKLDNARVSGAQALAEAEALARDLEAEATAHEGSGLSEGAYGVMQVLLSFDVERERGGDLARRIEALYTDEAKAPLYWQEKEGLRKELRQGVRTLANDHGVAANLIDLARKVEEFAVIHFARV